jgi:hypothetical protein
MSGFLRPEIRCLISVILFLAAFPAAAQFGPTCRDCEFVDDPEYGPIAVCAYSDYGWVICGTVYDETGGACFLEAPGCNPFSVPILADRGIVIGTIFTSTDSTLDTSGFPFVSNSESIEQSRAIVAHTAGVPVSSVRVHAGFVAQDSGSLRCGRGSASEAEGFPSQVREVAPRLSRSASSNLAPRESNA